MNYKDPGKIEFQAVLRAQENGTYIDFPLSVEELFGVKGRVPVVVVFDGKVSYRGSLVKMGSECHLLGVRRSIREELHKKVGDTINVVLELDKTERKVELPLEIEVILKEEGLLDVFNKTSFTHQREYIESIVVAKKPETKEKRVDLLLDYLKRKIPN